MALFPIGLHAGNTGLSPAPYIRGINAAGHGAFLKVVDDAGRANEAIRIGQDHGVENLVVYRSTAAGDLPDYSLDPEEAARRHFAAHRPYWGDLHPDVWVETINEPDRNRWEWVGRYCYEMALFCLAEGRRWCGPGSNSGEPEYVSDWTTDGWRNLFLLASDHPGHLAVAVHQYNWGNEPWSANYPYHVGREDQIRQACATLRLPVPPIIVTEWGFAYDHAPPWGEVAPFVQACIDYYGERGMSAALWCYQDNGQSVRHDVVRYEPHLGALAAAWEPPAPPPEPEPTHWGADLWRASIEAQTVSLNPDAALQAAILGAPGRWVPVGSEFWRTGPDGVQRAAMPAEELETGARRVYYAEVPRWNDIGYIEGAETPPEVPTLDVLAYSQRDPRWAGVTLGQDTGHGETIGSWGCLLVAYTMQAQQLGIADVTPLAMNERMVAAGAFSRQFIQPGALRTAYPTQVIYDGYMRRDNPAMAPTIEQWLADGYSVPVRVDFKPATAAWEQHWCLVIGGTADNWIVADPWTGEIGPLADVYGIAGEDVLEAVFYRPRPPAPPPAGEAIDLLPYLLPDADRNGPTYELRRADGSQERVQVQPGIERRFYVTKGTGGLLGRAEWELLAYDDDWIWRGMDTSPGGGRYYVQWEPGRDMARWCPRRMVPGVWWEGPGHQVQFYDKATCAPSDANSGPAVNRMVLASVGGDDVVLTNGTETWRLRRGIGMVGWTSPWGASELSELHPPGARPDNVREVIPCADAPPGEAERYW